MPEPTDQELLAHYGRTGSETAFAALVNRHLNLVYSAALRFTNDHQLAEEIVQAVFIVLARKAASISPKVLLTGWLYQAARFTALKQREEYQRRRQREREAYVESAINASDHDEVWKQIGPALDEAMNALRPADRDVILLRYFGNRTLAEVGSTLGVNEDAAQKRVSRALEKLRALFGKRGARFTVALLAAAVSANSVQAAPTGLAKTITVVAGAKGAAATASTLALVKGTLSMMTWMKAKTLIAVGATAAVIAGAATWQTASFRSDVLDQQPPQVKILPSKFDGNSHGWGTGGRMAGTGVRVQTIVEAAYGFATSARTVSQSPLPDGYYDYIASLTNGNAEALRQEVKRQFHLIASTQIRETNVMVLQKKAAAGGLKPSTAGVENCYEVWNSGHYESKYEPLGHFACVLEQSCNRPVVDRTGLASTYDLNVNWIPGDLKDGKWDIVNQKLLLPLGLELVPTNLPIEMLVVEQAN
jgi:uncharacterized protein (TIGR03435 family)